MVYWLKRCLWLAAWTLGVCALASETPRVCVAKSVAESVLLGNKVGPMSGARMLRLYEQAGWTVLRQSGSHVTMGRGTDRQSIPMHRELKKGLQQALLKHLVFGGEAR